MDLNAHVELVYEELRRRAVLAMRDLPPGQTIQPTVLVHDAFVALSTRNIGPINSHEHFIAIATKAIRSAMIDRVRARTRVKRGGGVAPLSLGADLDIAMPRATDDVILGIDELLDQLRRTDERAASVVELRFFMGMTEPEAARALGVTERTIRRDWTFAKSWLMKALSERGTQWSGRDEP